MAVLILSWIVVAFLFALLAHTIVPDDGSVDVDVTVVLGMTGALLLGATANHLVGQPIWGLHLAGFAGGAIGAIGGVAMGAMGQRRRDALR
ncbi:MAG: hypothetical protein M3Y87_01120 [Myxococcota bacterium]|nr:hypothetical protein [Myxococcota bacterium]